MTPNRSRILVFDTETTGKWDFASTVAAPGQPHLVQYAGVLLDEDGTQLGALATIVRLPEGVTIPVEATAVHGITDAQAALGWDRRQVFDWHLDLVASADMIVAHNLDFDARVMAALAARLGRSDTLKAVLAGRATFDTMLEGTALCRIPSPRRIGYKWPKLVELHQHLFGDTFPAHDALADAKACARCFLAMRKPKPGAGDTLPAAPPTPFEEGPERKGGVNTPPTEPRPEPPQAHNPEVRP